MTVDYEPAPVIASMLNYDEKANVIQFSCPVPQDAVLRSKYTGETIVVRGAPGPENQTPVTRAIAGVVKARPIRAGDEFILLKEWGGS